MNLSKLNPLTFPSRIAAYARGDRHMVGAYPTGTPVDQHGNKLPPAVPLGDPNFVHEKRNSAQMRNEAIGFEKAAAAVRDNLRLNLGYRFNAENDPSVEANPEVKAALAENNRMTKLAANAASDAALYDGMGKVILGSVLFIGALIGGVALDEAGVI